MVPCSALVLLEYFSQFSYTDVESTPGASTCRRNVGSGDLFSTCDGSARGSELTCLAAWKMTFCTDGIPEALRVALAAGNRRVCYGSGFRSPRRTLVGI